LYSESNSRFVVGVAPEATRAFEGCLQGQTGACIGSVRRDEGLLLRGREGNMLVDQPLGALKAAWKEALGDL
jgi:hypothetical protein